MSNKKLKKPKDKNLNVRLSVDDYEKLQKIADDLGGMSLSSMIRMLIFERLKEYDKTGDPRSLVNMSKEDK